MNVIIGSGRLYLVLMDCSIRRQKAAMFSAVYPNYASYLS